VSAPVLATPDFDKPFILTVDASDFCAGAVLLQEDSKGVDNLIGYFLHKFNTAQRNCSTRHWYWFMHFNILTFTSTLLNILYNFIYGPQNQESTPLAMEFSSAIV